MRGDEAAVVDRWPTFGLVSLWDDLRRERVQRAIESVREGMLRAVYGWS